MEAKGNDQRRHQPAGPVRHLDVFNDRQRNIPRNIATNHPTDKACAYGIRRQPDDKSWRDAWFAGNRARYSHGNHHRQQPKRLGARVAIACHTSNCPGVNVSCTVPPSPMPMAIINPEPQTMGIRNEIAVSRCPLGFAACHICFRDISHAL